MIKTLYALCAVFTLQLTVAAVDITVGTTRLNIPAPEGYVTVTSNMKPYADIAKRFVAPSNQQYALFISDESATIAKKGGTPESPRKFALQVPKQIIKPTIAKADFAKFKSILKTQNEKLMKQAEAEMPGIVKKMTDGLSKNYDVNLNVTSLQMLPLPPHDETDRSLAFSTLLKFNIDDGTGNTTPEESIVTTTAVHIKGKVILLYVYGAKTDLDWTKTASKTWATRIIAENPSTGTVAKQENKSRPAKSSAGIDWTKALISGAVAAVVGGIAALISMILKKKKPKA